MSTAAQAVPPWGTSRLRPFPPAVAVPGVAAEIDPDTQLGIVRDGAGQVVEMGKHGTGTGRETSTSTSPDGQNGADQGSDQEHDSD
ncbi:putative ATP-grasp-modified RiPP [Streptomyces sp. CA-253872]|uniref:putative ATP-grasp-modified RiPP n=1 Tax=Streptomyces sp. CA-253872 TaxID=3240067 RepID=UPI003D8AD25F